MERYLRFYIKFQGYIIAICTIFGSVFMGFLIYSNNSFHYPLEEFYDYRFMGSAGLLFGLIWLLIGVSMLYGLIREDKRFVYPFVVMFMLELFLLLARDMALIWTNKSWYHMVFVNPALALIALFICVHTMMSLVALGKLFEHDPLAQSGTNFVRFKTTGTGARNGANNRGDEEASGDEVSLVE
ncbi:uncharacterized protein LOC129755155 [Uranotaenia lowii]|uniref:uncharacterized protein LOC129755155 n=1 Tax=Uranotaenia lowii TaxID=190385 RepID=UPI002478CD1C|nr:uncharacterized protein LOC129755155 [Uranotaenia lowii]